MLQGYLHFDCTRGLSATMLSGAMAELLPPSDKIQKIFNAFGLGEISYEIVSDSLFQIKGSLLQFYVNNTQILAGFAHVPKKSASLSPMWHKSLSDEQAPSQENNYENIKHSLIRSCLLGQEQSLKDLQKFFLSSNAYPQISAIAIKILENLQSPRFNHHRLSGSDALWLVCQTLMLTAQLDALDPKMVSATPIHLSSTHTQPEGYKHLQFFDSLWIKDILRSIPFVEVNESKEVDALGVAFLKSVVGRIGARGACTIMKVGVGLGREPKLEGTNLLEAQWCEASLPSTMQELGPSKSFDSRPLYEVQALVPMGSDMPALISMLSLYGASSLSYHVVHAERNSDANLVRFLVDHDHKHDCLEAFLIKGAAQMLSLSAIECHDVSKRLVVVPLGSGNKITTARFFEYIYYDKCVRVDPLKEDLDIYAQKTNYSIDVARSDLLMAWKKWRGKQVSDGQA